MWKQINNISRYCGNHDLISPDHGKHPSESSGTLLMHLSESRARKNNVLFHKLQAAGISVVTESVFGFTKLILHHPRAVTAASRGSTIADLALRITHQPEPYIRWSRFTHAQPCLTLISTVWALVCATAPPVQSPAKASAILNESVTAVTASRFSPVYLVLIEQTNISGPVYRCTAHLCNSCALSGINQHFILSLVPTISKCWPIMTSSTYEPAAGNCDVIMNDCSRGVSMNAF